MPDSLTALNQQQLEAVKTTEGPLLILAGAGTGKTKTLTSRFVYVLNKQLASEQEILCVTFTNKAAKEMEARIRSFNKKIGYLPWLGTFHRIGAKFLRLHAPLAGLTSNFIILDKLDSLKILKTIDSNIAPMLGGYIEKWKNKGLLPSEVSEKEYAEACKNAQLVYGYLRYNEPAIFYEYYKTYQATLRKYNSCDFSDLLLKPLKILQTHENVREHYQERIKYIFVDEYQDTNLVQYLFLQILAQKHQNICCVGDDDQAIYGWRGADVSHILRFEKDFPKAKLIKLECNYRSTTPILESANHIIKENSQRIGKNLYSYNKNIANNVSVNAFPSGSMELDYICEAILNLQMDGHKLNDIAIIVRLRSQLKELEGYLLKHQLKYQLIGEASVFEAKEVKDILAYLRLIAYSDDDLAFERIVNVPKRAIGKTSLDKIKEYANTHQISLYSAGLQLINNKLLAKKASNSLMNFYNLIKNWQEISSHMPIAGLTQEILLKTAYIENLKDEKEKRQANLQILLNDMQNNEGISLSEYLQNVALSSQKAGKVEDAVNIMTIHGAKGLEFQTVFSPAWEENILPFVRYGQMQENYTDIEEERRLAYVAITRAKENLYLSFSMFRMKHGSSYYNRPSRFLDDLPKQWTNKPVIL